MKQVSTPYSSEADEAFDQRIRTELAVAFKIDAIPKHLQRETPWLQRNWVQRGIAALLITGTTTTAVLAMRPPELVRGAIEHEYYERTLRGNFMTGQELLKHLGQGHRTQVPGYPQLMRPCDIKGLTAYHLTTFFDKGGMVTVFSFEKPVALAADSGWWNDVYWQVVTSTEGKPLVMVAQKKKALEVAQASLTQPAPASSTSGP